MLSLNGCVADMTETETASDVVFHQPQIVSEVETIFAPSTAAGGAASCRPQSGAMELGRRLLLAARAGDTSLVLDLMAKGAPFTNDWLGTSPLHLAASNAHAETCGVLLRAGVSRESRTKVDRTPLHLAAYAGHADVVELLLQHGAQVDCRDMLRMTPLHWAAQRGHAGAAAALLQRGADVKALSKFRKTPPQLAAAAGHRHVLALLDAEVKRREADHSVRAIVADRAAEETAATEAQRPAFTTVHRTIQEVRLKPKPEQEKTVKPDSKAEQAEGAAAGAGAGGAGAGGAGAGGAAAALLRRHGITLLPHDDGSTVLSALQSGRTVVLSDAGKLMLKESEEPSPPASAGSTPAAPRATGARAARGVLLTATPVRSTPRGVKVFTVNNRLSVTPSETRPRTKIMSPQDLQQVKIVQLPADARIVSPRRPRRVRVASTSGGTAPARTPVKLIVNKANFQRLIASAKTEPEPQPEQETVLDAATGLTEVAPVEQDSGPECIAESTLEPSEEVPVLRALLAQARATVAALSDELAACRARLALYEPAE